MVHEAIFIKDIERLFKLVYFIISIDSKCGSPPFSQPKTKTNQFIFNSDLRNINRQLKHKLYPMPKIIKIMLKLGFYKYAT